MILCKGIETQGTLFQCRISFLKSASATGVLISSGLNVREGQRERRRGEDRRDGEGERETFAKEIHKLYISNYFIIVIDRRCNFIIYPINILSFKKN
jgi:hypothetical protein